MLGVTQRKKDKDVSEKQWLDDLMEWTEITPSDTTLPE